MSKKTKKRKNLKSKKTRSKTSKRKKRSGRSPSSTKSASSAKRRPEKKSTKKTDSTRQELGHKASELEKVQGIRAAWLFKASILSPFFFISWLSGLSLPSLYTITIGLFLSIFQAYLGILGGDKSFTKGVLWVGQLISLLVVYGQSSDIQGTLLLGVCFALIFAAERERLSSLRQVLGVMAAYAAFSMLIGLVAVRFSQREFLVETSFIGFLICLAPLAAIWCWSTETLEKQGLMRARERGNSFWDSLPELSTKGSIFKRRRKKTQVPWSIDADTTKPGPLAQVFAGLVFVGPIACLTLAPLVIIPRSFFILSLALLYAPSLAQAYLERTESEQTIAKKALRLAGLEASLVLVAILAQDFF